MFVRRRPSPLRFFERLGSKDEEKLFGREHWHSDSRDVADKEETGMNAYRHTVQYYETDRMGIVHHSNYIRWMEEARVDYLAQLGWGLERLEAFRQEWQEMMAIYKFVTREETHHE